MDEGTVSEYAGQLAVYREVMGDESAELWVLAPTLGSVLQLVLSTPLANTGGAGGSGVK